MSVTVTKHERPGVYSVYDASNLVRGRGVKQAALIAKADGGNGKEVHTWQTYAQALNTLEENSEMAELVRLLFLNGAASVLGIPVGEDDHYTTAIQTAEELEKVGVLVCDSTSLEVQQAVRDSMERCGEVRRERVAVVPGGTDETVTQLCSRAQNLNHARMVLVAPGMTGAARGAAAVAGAIAGESDPAVPLGGAELLGLSGLNTRYTDSEIDELVRGGVTPLECVSGSVSVVRGITTKTKSGGVEDSTWRELSTILIVDEVIPGIRDALRVQFQRTKNTAQTRNAIRSQVILELENRMKKEMITGYEDVAVTALEDDPTVCLVEFAFTVSHGLNQIWISAHVTI